MQGREAAFVLQSTLNCTPFPVRGFVCLHRAVVEPFSFYLLPAAFVVTMLTCRNLFTLSRLTKKGLNLYEHKKQTLGTLSATRSAVDAKQTLLYSTLGKCEGRVYL